MPSATGPLIRGAPLPSKEESRITENKGEEERRRRVIYRAKEYKIQMWNKTRWGGCESMWPLSWLWTLSFLCFHGCVGYMWVLGENGLIRYNRYSIVGQYYCVGQRFFVGIWISPEHWIDIFFMVILGGKLVVFVEPRNKIMSYVWESSELKAGFY